MRHAPCGEDVSLFCSERPDETVEEPSNIVAQHGHSVPVAMVFQPHADLDLSGQFIQRAGGRFAESGCNLVSHLFPSLPRCLTVRSRRIAWFAR